MYIDVDTVPGPVELRINTVGSGFDREWEIEVTQVRIKTYKVIKCLRYAWVKGMAKNEKLSNIMFPHLT